MTLAGTGTVNAVCVSGACHVADLPHGCQRIQPTDGTVTFSAVRHRSFATVFPVLVCGSYKKILGLKPVGQYMTAGTVCRKENHRKPFKDLCNIRVSRSTDCQSWRIQRVDAIPVALTIFRRARLLTSPVAI